MSDKALNILTWNVRGISSKSLGKVKRGRLRNNLRTLTSKPRIVFIQEHKVPEADCAKFGALGIRKGKGFWNGGCYYAANDRWKVDSTSGTGAKKEVDNPKFWMGEAPYRITSQYP
jgi:exonuclease III